MKKMTSYFVFFLISVSLWGQSDLPILHSFSAPAADLLPGYRPISTPRAVQSRNFVELQLDSVHYVWYNNEESYVARRLLYSYAGDTVVLHHFYHPFGGAGQYNGSTKVVFNDLNLPVYSQVVYPGTLNPEEEWRYYNPVYPTVLDSVRSFFQYDDGINFDSKQTDYNLFEGTPLVQSKVFRSIEASQFVSVETTLYEYDSQQREVLEAIEVQNIGLNNITSHRLETEYLADSTVLTTSFLLPGNVTWNLNYKLETAFVPGSSLPLRTRAYFWVPENELWRPATFQYFTYDADNREILMKADAFSADGLSSIREVETTYVQDNYIDSIVFYQLLPNSTYEQKSYHKYYYASSSSSVVQPATGSAVDLAPNPAHAYLRARTEQNIQLAELYDLQGRLVMNIATEGTNVLHLHRNNLPSGTYVLRLQLENGATVSERVQWE